MRYEIAGRLVEDALDGRDAEATAFLRDLMDRWKRKFGEAIRVEYDNATDIYVCYFTEITSDDDSDGE